MSNYWGNDKPPPSWWGKAIVVFCALMLVAWFIWGPR